VIMQGSFGNVTTTTKRGAGWVRFGPIDLTTAQQDVFGSPAVLAGAAQDDRGGIGMAVADVDDDGYDDVLFPVPMGDTYGSNAGLVGVFRGGGTLARTWYADADHDGYGDPEDTVFDCEPPAGYVALPGPPPE